MAFDTTIRCARLLSHMKPARAIQMVVLLTRWATIVFRAASDFLNAIDKSTGGANSHSFLLPHVPHTNVTSLGGDTNQVLRTFAAMGQAPQSGHEIRKWLKQSIPETPMARLLLQCTCEEVRSDGACQH